MGDTAKNLVVGAFVLAACALVMWTLLSLKPRVGDQAHEIHALFSDINKITVGTPVNYAGRPVGEVVEIRSVPDPRGAKADNEGRLYVYEVVMKVDSSVRLFDTDRVTVATSGLLGEKSVALIPQKPADGSTPQPVDSQLLYAESSDALDTVVRQVGSLAKDIGKTFADFGGFLKANEKEFHVALDEFGQAMKSVRTAIDQMEREQMFADLPASITHLRSILSAVDRPEELESIVNHVCDISCNLSQTTGGLERGEGTLGALLKKEDLYDEIKRLITQAEQAISNINRYGLLFHNNKRWQRMQQPQAASCVPVAEQP
jgi:phospholipid/cholesterol/gamma-HCH transport system substrate-binding protein